MNSVDGMSTMLANGEVERIVAEVVKRLRQIAAAPSNQIDGAKLSQSMAPLEPTKPSAIDPQVSGELTLKDQVITLASLQGRLSGKTRLLVTAKAVITPAARDELRKAGVQLERSQIAGKDSSSVTLINLTKDVDVQGVVSALRQLGQPIEMQNETELAALQRRLEGIVRSPYDLAAIVTRQPDVALIVANRRRSVRAVCAGSANGLADLVRTTGANVLVINPAGRGERDLVDVLLQFGNNVPRQSPHPFFDSIN